MTDPTRNVTWHRALEPDELPEGRVKPVTLGTRTVCMTHHEGTYGALDNRCPHQGGPLGEGSIENGYLRCPWHGWDYCPLSGKPPGGYDDGVETFGVEVRVDGGFGQSMGELLTAVKYGTNITHVLLNNGQLGKISKEQRAGSWPVWQTALHNPSFAEYARICGAQGLHVTDAAAIDEALREGLAHDGPSIVEVMTDAELV